MYEYGCTKANSEIEERLEVELVYLVGPQAVKINRADMPANSLSFIMIIVLLSQIYTINSFLDALQIIFCIFEVSVLQVS